VVDLDNEDIRNRLGLGRPWWGRRRKVLLRPALAVNFCITARRYLAASVVLRIAGKPKKHSAVRSCCVAVSLSTAAVIALASLSMPASSDRISLTA